MRDLSTSPRLPATVDTSKFEVGGNLAATPGSVVLRTEVFELIHYRPSTDQVREVPLLFIPPTINKYYILDIAPGRSMIEHFVAQGQQVFAISWRNPEPGAGSFRPRHLRGSCRGGAQRGCLDHAADQVHLAAACSGGIITAGLLGRLAADGELDGVASLTLMVCALDNESEGTLSALAARDVAAAAIAESARKGYLDGQALAGVFTWLRPNDLVWNYVVNNYLLGKAPPAFDILYWNQDTVRLAAGLHRDFIHIGLDNPFARAGALEVLGRPVDLGGSISTRISSPAQRPHRPVGGRVPERGCSAAPAVRALEQRAHSGARQSPGGPESRSSFRVADELPRDRGVHRPGPEATGQLVARLGRVAGRAVGELKTAPKTLGNRTYRAQGKAPGTYVLAN